jgi:mono/diheme cytochrome c family protein
MRRVLTIFAAGAFLTVTSAASFQQGARPAAAGNGIDEGRIQFITYCSSCHGSAGRGDGPVADALKVRPADLTQIAKRTDGAFIAERIRRMVDGRDRYIKAHGSIEMPVWGDAFRRREGLGDEAIKARIDAIVKYLQSIQQRSG